MSEGKQNVWTHDMGPVIVGCEVADIDRFVRLAVPVIGQYYLDQGVSQKNKSTPDMWAHVTGLANDIWQNQLGLPGEPPEIAAKTVSRLVGGMVYEGSWEAFAARMRKSSKTRKEAGMKSLAADCAKYRGVSEKCKDPCPAALYYQEATRIEAEDIANMDKDAEAIIERAAVDEEGRMVKGYDLMPPREDFDCNDKLEQLKTLMEPVKAFCKEHGIPAIAAFCTSGKMEADDHKTTVMVNRMGGDNAEKRVPFDMMCAAKMFGGRQTMYEAAVVIMAAMDGIDKLSAQVMERQGEMIQGLLEAMRTPSTDPRFNN